MHLTGLRQFFLPKRRQSQRNSASRRLLPGRRTLITALLPLAILAAACSGDSDDSAVQQEATAAAAATVSATAGSTATVVPTIAVEPTKVTFMAGFKAQANLPFVGVYVAQEKGYFAEQNLEVEIRHAQTGEHLQLLLAGTIQFSTANGASVLKRNAEDLPLVALALIGQRSEQGFAVLADSDIQSVSDWSGKVFGYKGSAPPAEFYAIAAANGLDPDSVEQVRVSFDPRVLTEGQVDILPVFFSNEPDTIQRLGFETRIFDPNDFSIDSLGLTYISSREFLESEPEVVERFLRAALKGLEYAEANREEAVEIVLKFGPQEDREHQAFMLNTEFDRALTDSTREKGLGWQTQEQWQTFHDTLLEFGAIEKSVDVSTVFVDEYLQLIYEDGQVIWP